MLIFVNFIYAYSIFYYHISNLINISPYREVERAAKYLVLLLHFPLFAIVQPLNVNVLPYIALMQQLHALQFAVMHILHHHLKLVLLQYSK